MTTMTTTIFTVRPFARVPATDGDAGPILGNVQEALEQDSRVIAPVCGYDYARGELEAVFQLAADLLGEAGSRAVDILQSALDTAGISARAIGVSVVEGDDPDQLP